MAAIPRYQASVGIQSAGIPNTQLQSPDGAALAGVGNAIQDAAAVFEQKQNQRDEFKARNDYRKLQLDLDQGLTDAAQNAAEDGSGFHDGFVENVFRPKREEFLAKLPPKLRAQYETLLSDDGGSDATEWSYKAAKGERDIAANWVKNEVGVTQQQLLTGISRDPDAYDNYHQSGQELIDKAPYMTAQEKKIARQAWDEMAQTAFLNRTMEDDPQLVLRYLNANPNKLSPQSQFDVVSAAVQWKETGNNPDQISPAGAVGAMQVMPGTARDIAKEMGDPNFPTKGDPEQVTQYLLRPGVSKRYGDFYLKKLMKQFPGDIEAALVAYNGGPERAKAWVKAGRDDSVLPKETVDYYHKIRERLPGVMAPGAQGTAAANGKVEFVFDRSGMAALGSKQSTENLNPDLVDRTTAAFAAIGINKVKVNSGYRNPADNARVGGAKQSQHMHGNAIDIDVSGYSREQRIDIIKSLSANGITGLGIGANVIHADVGGRRVWGYPNVPKWASSAVAEHMQGKATPPRNGAGGRFATLSYEQRQKFINTADTQLSAKITREKAADSVARVQVKQDMTNELAVLAKTGQPSGKFDDTRVSTVLGEDDYLTWSARKNEAMKTFTARDGIVTMTPQEMEDRLQEYKADPASETFASDQKIEAAVNKEIDRVSTMRAKEPDKAAQLFPDVAAAVSKVALDMPKNEAQPADVQAMVALMLEKQKQFGIPEKALAPVPREWAFEIGKSLTRVPSRSEKGVSADDVRAGIAVQYNALHQFFGEYTDEVILYALSEYKGLDKGTSEMITNLMARVARGQDPFKPRDNDMGDVEQMAEPGFFSYEYWFGRDDAADGETGDTTQVEGALDRSSQPEPPEPELILRAVRALDDADTPEDEQAIVDQYGQAAVDAAKLRREQGATQ